MDVKRKADDSSDHDVKRVTRALLPALHYRYTPVKGNGMGQISFDKDGNLVVANSENNTVVEYAYNSFFSQSRKIGEGMHKAPIACVVDGKGRFFVSEFGDNCVRVFHDDDGTKDFIFTVLGPHGLALNENLLYVCSVPRSCWPKVKTPGAVKIFNASDGSALGEISNGRKFYPQSVGVLSTGQVVVSCQSYPGSLCVFNGDGSLASSFGQDWLPNPRQLAVGARDVIYVVDTKKHSVIIFLADGTVLAHIGYKGTGEGRFYRPYGVAIRDSDLMVSDLGRIQIFG
jgi:DNA-binding beta-propeller fold protein YncE